jgi:hypothetical protein
MLWRLNGREKAIRLAYNLFIKFSGITGPEIVYQRCLNLNVGLFASRVRTIGQQPGHLPKP